MQDRFGRTIDYLRISVTDRCNERCLYCMPAEGVQKSLHRDILTYDEIVRVARAAAGLGVSKIRITGGEPLVRKNLADLVREIHGISGIDEISLTTNGTLLAGEMKALMAAGLHSVNISLDTADEKLYETITRGGQLSAALQGIDAAMALERQGSGAFCKLDCVLLGLPGQKLTDVASFARDRKIHVRFIELMPIGTGKEWNRPFMKEADAKAVIEAEFGPLIHTEEKLGNGPAEYYRVEGFAGRIGFISAMSHKFCGGCNRVRLTSQGFFMTCLQYHEGRDLRKLLRGGCTDSELAEAMRSAILDKPKEHAFYAEKKADEETAPMNAIGG